MCINAPDIKEIIASLEDYISKLESHLECRRDKLKAFKTMDDERDGSPS